MGDLIASALVVDERPGAELTDGQKAGPLQVVAVTALRAPAAGDVGGERQPGKEYPGRNPSEAK